MSSEALTQYQYSGITSTTTTIVFVMWCLDSIPIHNTNTVVPPPQPPPLNWSCEVWTKYQYIIPIQWYYHHNHNRACEVWTKYQYIIPIQWYHNYNHNSIHHLKPWLNTNTVVPLPQPPPLYLSCDVLTQYQYIIPIQWYHHHNPHHFICHVMYWLNTNT